MLRAIALLAFAVSADATCNTEYDSTDLSSAVDAALMELQGTAGWFSQLNTDHGSSYMQINSCTADPTKWDYPAAAAATGLLRRVLASGELKVAATPWAAGTTSYCAPDAASCGGSAALGVQDPTGYWVDMMSSIAEKLSLNYNQPITVRRVYYDNSDLVNDAVANSPELVDMSEPYYYLGSSFNNNPRFEHFHFSCITAAASTSFFTSVGSGITDTTALVNHINTASSVADRTMGFIGAGNYDSVASILPSTVIASYNLGEFDDIKGAVQDGTFIGGYKSEGGALDSTIFNTFDTGIISPRAILFRLDEECVCDHAAPTMPPPPPTPPSSDINNETGLTIALIVVASVLLILALLLAFVIVRERAQKPLFMPLLATTNTGTALPKV